MYPIISKDQNHYKIKRMFPLSSFMKKGNIVERAVEEWKVYLEATHVLFDQKQILFCTIIKDAEYEDIPSTEIISTKS